MRVAITTAVHKRPVMTRLWYTAARRVAEQWAVHDVTLYAGGDDPRHRAMAEEFDAVWLEVPNDPLGGKWNAIVHRAWQDGHDYVVQLPSDDLMSPVMADRYLTALTPEPRYAAIRSVYICHPPSAEAMLLKAYSDAALRAEEPVGPGRLMSRDLLTELRGMPWFPLQRRMMDWNFTQNLRWRTAAGTKWTAIPWDGEAFLLDVKGPDNIWSWDHTHALVDRGLAYDVDLMALVAQFPTEERQLLYLLAMGAV